MKSLLFILLFFVSFSAFSQQPTGSFAMPNASRGIRYNGLMGNTELYFPIYDTMFTPLRQGAVTRRPQDTTAGNNIFYTWIGYKWTAIDIAGGGGGTGGSGLRKVYSDLWLSNTNDSTIKSDSAAMASYFLRRKDSGVNYVTPFQLGGYIPLGGTVAGKPVTGKIQLTANEDEPFQVFFGNPSSGPFASIGSSLGSDLLMTARDGTGNNGAFSFSGASLGIAVAQDEATQGHLNFNSISGLSSQEDFSSNYDPYTYVQKIYTDKNLDTLYRSGDSLIVFKKNGTRWGIYSPTSTGGGGTGTVSTLSVTTANGISGTVANASTTPAITLSLGAITPTSVAAIGTVTGSNLSGTNTGNETTTSINTLYGYTPANGANYLPVLGGTITGTAGNGFINFIPQSSNPSAPATGYKLFATSAGSFAWMTNLGYSREFRVRAQTQSNIYHFYDRSYTVADSADVAAEVARATTAEATKQATLVSGTNIKTVNSNSILGSGNLVVSGSPDASKKDTTGIYGTIYNKSSWTSGTLASDFTINTATPTLSGSKFTISGGTLTPGPPPISLDINGFHCLENWRMAARFTQQTTKSSTTFGAGIGIKSTAANFPTSIIAYVDLSNGASAGKLTIISTVSGTSVSSVSTTALTYTANTDKIEISFERVGNRFYAWARNATTNSSPIFTSIIYSSENNGSAPFNLPNTGRFAVWTIGGTSLIDSLYAGSNEMTRPDVVVLGDSKFVGYNANYNTSTVNLIRSQGVNVVNLSGGGNRAEDIYNNWSDVKRIMPKQVLWEAGTNDGVDSVSVKTYTQRMADSCHAYGISFILLRPLRQAVEAWPGRTAWIDRTYSTDSIIDIRTRSYYAGALSSDSVHLTNYGDSLAAEDILMSGKLRGGGMKREIIVGQLIPDGTEDPITLQWGNMTIINKAFPTFAYLHTNLNSSSTTPTYFGSGRDGAKLYFNTTNNFQGLVGSDLQGLIVTPTNVTNQRATLVTPQVSFTNGGGTIVGAASVLTITPLTGATAIPAFYASNGTYGTQSTPSPSSLHTYFSTTKGTIPAPAMSATSGNAIPVGLISTGTPTGGSGYTNGTYTSVALTGGTGSGAIATVVVSGGAVNSVTISTLGANYLVGDVLGIPQASVGGTGTGASYLVTALSTEGLMYFDNTAHALRVNDGTRWVYGAKILKNSATLDFPSTATGIASDLTVTVTGAALGDVVSIGVPNGSMTATAQWFGWVSATNTVTIRYIPHATEDPASGTFNVKVFKD